MKYKTWGGIFLHPVVTQLLADISSLKIDYTAACESDEYHCKRRAKLEVYWKVEDWKKAWKSKNVIKKLESTPKKTKIGIQT